MKKFLSKASGNLQNIPGWRTGRRIVVFESDDWGSIRMPSKDVYNNLISRGFKIDGSDYNRLDSLENNDDLLMLYEVLRSHKDKNGNPAIMTANLIVANPDFKKIKESEFTQFFYEPVIETLQRYPNHDNVVKLWKEGVKERLFYPQFHGREHVNVVRWLEALRQKTPEIMVTFDYETTFSGNGDYNFMEVLDFNSHDDISLMKESISDGLNLFEHIIGYRSKSFIPPCYTWDSSVEETLYKCGVRYIQGLVVQLLPTGSFGKYKKRYHFLGGKNKLGQYYLVRNAFFEPSLSKSTDTVGECLNRIETAFRWHKPAIIGTHRINFIGSIDVRNRERNLRFLDELLRRMLQKWPDIEFMTSEQLGDLIAETK